MERDSKIYVAGHTGLIGRSLLQKLREAGYANIIVKTRSELDLRDQRAVRDFFNIERPEYVFLAAGKVGSIQANRTHQADFLLENTEIQVNVLSAAHNVGVKRLIFFGSSCMYPKTCAQPMREEELLRGLPEETSLGYAIAKISGMKLVEYLHEQYGTDFVTVIPNTAYGPGDNFSLNEGHVLSVFLRRFEEAVRNNTSTVELWGTGLPQREFVYADDIADACMFIMNQPNLPWRTMNIASSSEVSIRELAELVAHTVGFSGTITWDASKPDGALRKLLSGERLQSLGWEAKIGLLDGLARTYSWYKENLKNQ